MEGVKKNYSLELNLMFQNLKTEELDVIITRKENSVTGSNTVHISVKEKIPQTLQSDCPFGTRKNQTCCYCYFKAKAPNTQVVNVIEVSNC